MRAPTRTALPLSILLSSISLGPSARADQCAWISTEQADRALRLLQPGTEYLLYCEPCGEKKPTSSGAVQFAEVRVVDGGKYREVVIDGKEVDLAYTFVKTDASSSEYENLARLAGCPATSVSDSITASGTAQGKAKKHGAWYGRYSKKQGQTEILLREAKLHPAWVEATITLTSEESGDQRATLTGYLHVEKNPATFVTAFRGCALIFAQKAGGLAVRDNGRCGALMKVVAGEYAK
jgi:hypothetical protein